MKSKIKSNSEHLSEFATLHVNAFWGVVIEVVVQRCSVKKVFLEISQNSQENTCARVSFLIKLQVLYRTSLVAPFIVIFFLILPKYSSM